MKFIYVNCSWRNEYGSDPCSYEHYLNKNENKVWKNSGLYDSSIFITTKLQGLLSY